MINGTEIESIVNYFNENTWTVFVVTIGIIAMAIYGLGHPLWNYVQRPKIILSPRISVEDVKRHDKFDYKRVVFRIHLKNTGKFPAFQCRVRMRIVDHSGKIDMVRRVVRSIDDDFAVPCTDLDNLTAPTIDLLPTKRHEGFLEIPLRLELATNTDDVLGDDHMPIAVTQFLEPIEMMRWDLLANDDNIIQCRFEITITSQNTLFKTKKFEISIPYAKGSMIEPKNIQFTQLKRKYLSR